MIGRIVSHYRITDEIGGGGMGVVYKAEDTKLGRTVALKFLSPDKVGDTGAKTRFVNEAKAASALQHNNICTIHEIDETDDGQLFICMDSYEGQSLRDKISRGPLSVDDALDIAIQSAQGLVKAHGIGMIHRDIKPANIVVTDEGVVKILDFGLAKLGKDSRLTKTGAVLGTLAYMSPEQARGEELDARTDIYSLGVVLYEMLSGKMPFTADNDAARLYKVLSANPSALGSLRNDLPGGLEQIVETAIAKDRDDRCKSAADFLFALRKVRGESDLQPPRPSTGRIRGPVVAWILTAAALASLALALGPRLLDRNRPSPHQQKLAVLPFQNIGESEDEYFADGITEEIRSRLSRLSGLAVVSRTSSMKYKNSPKSLLEIGNELGVDLVLEGTIRYEQTAGGERARIVPRLVNVTDDVHIWSETYDGILDSIFAFQSGIADRVAEALDIAVLDPERRALIAVPTDNLDAYHAYLRAKSRMITVVDDSEQNMEMVIQLLTRAISLDPEFALAYAELSRVHGLMYSHDPTDRRRLLARSSADKALNLDPELPQAHLADGFYYFWCEQSDYEIALEKFKMAERIAPGNVEVLLAMGAAYKRMGQLDDARTYLARAFARSPREPGLPLELSVVCRLQRRFRDAVDYADRYIAIVPDKRTGYWFKAWIYQSSMGDLETSRTVLETAPEDPGGGYWWLMTWFMQEYYERDYAAALRWLEELPPASGTTLNLKGAVYLAMGEREQAASAFDSARTALEENLHDRPDSPIIHADLGLSLAGLGLEEDAIRHGLRAVELLPMSRDILAGSRYVEQLAVIYTMAGEDEAALDQIDDLLASPSNLSIANLKLNPVWDPLRTNTRFQLLVK